MWPISILQGVASLPAATRFDYNACIAIMPGNVMANLTIRNLDDELKSLLRQQVIGNNKVCRMGIKSVETEAE